MDDPISRAEAIDASEKLITDCNPEHFVGHQKFIKFMGSAEIGSFGKWQFANGFNMGLTAAEVAIKKLPTIDAEPVRHGKWDKGTDSSWHICEECGAEVDISMGTGVWFEGVELHELKYCPNCGTRMDEE